MGLRGLEPPWVAPTDPKSVASASFATGPERFSLTFCTQSASGKLLEPRACNVTNLRHRKSLIDRQMPKKPKFNRGFTWRHHLDEWWDRRPHEWKIRLFLVSGLIGVALLGGFVFYVHQWAEKDALLTEAKRIHQSRIENSDKLISAKPREDSGNTSREAVTLQIRSGE